MKSLMVALLAVMFPACASADAYSAAAGELAGGLPEGSLVCVLPLRYLNGGAGARGGAVVAERLDTEIIKTGRLKVLERAKIEKALSGAGLGPAGIDDGQAAAKAGSLLGADYVVTGTLFKKTGGRLELNARVIEISGGAVRAAVKASIKQDWLEANPENGNTSAAAFSVCKAAMYALDKRDFANAAGLFSKAIEAEPDGSCGMGIPGMAFMGRSMAYQEKSAPGDDDAAPAGPRTGYTFKEQEEVRGRAADERKRLARYEALIKAMPDNAAAYFGRGTILTKFMRYREARRDFDKAIKLAPGKPEYYYARGYVQDMLGYSDNAAVDYSAVIRLDPSYARAYNSRGNIYKRTEQYSKAMADYDKALELDPKDAIPYMNRGALLFVLGRYKEAMADCDKAVQLDPGTAEAYQCRGSARMALKDYDGAIRDFDKALELKPDYRAASEKRTEAADRKSGKFDKYDGDMKKAREIFGASGRP